MKFQHAVFEHIDKPTLRVIAQKSRRAVGEAKNPKCGIYDGKREAQIDENRKCASLSFPQLLPGCPAGPLEKQKIRNVEFMMEKGKHKSMKIENVLPSTSLSFPQILAALRNLAPHAASNRKEPRTPRGSFLPIIL